MTKAGTAPVAAGAMDVVDLGLRACAAFDRPDLAARLTEAKRRLADPVVHVVVAGEFKQGKSSLVNALVGAQVCPVDDDAATAVPTFVRHGEQPRAELWRGDNGTGGRREAIELADVRRHVVETQVGDGEPRVGGVEVRIPRALLATGLVLVDTPGIGGLGSAHAAASLAAISFADAVLFVTSAAQELTRSEMEFLRRARSMCPMVACVLTKTDFYPAWRRIRDLDAAHLAAEGDIPLLTVSSALRARAVRNSDAELNAESGFPDLITLVREQVGGSAEQRLATEAAAEVVALCDHLETSFTAERAALADPAAAQRVVDELTAVKSNVERLTTAAAKWSQTLSDGIGDLTSDIDFDLRTRIKEVTAEADQAIEADDPADTWAEFAPWLQARTAEELLSNYELLRERATELSEKVGDHFREATGAMLTRPTVHDPTSFAAAEVGEDLDLQKMRVVKQFGVVLKGLYSGAMMFTVVGGMVGVVLGPIVFGIGLVLGQRGLREEKKRQVQKRRAEAKNAVRRYCDKIIFVAGKDSRDTLRRVQRELRDHYTALAEELNRSNARALTAASEAAQRTKADREKRLKDVDAELARIAQLRQRAEAVAGS
ncbi:dynamin family protein [Saccharothrix deserti]|uniref:dynamin family protein n=1 Tax=Saccharothrix deserti TaxID=2593674 RepID=UPI00131D7643|nr:dynamin family protein [Saccharothrix deserti]